MSDHPASQPVTLDGRSFHGIVLEAGKTAGDADTLPGWFCYEPMLLAADAVPRKVPLAKPHFDLDLDAIEAALGPRTRLVIVNATCSSWRAA